MEFNFLHHVFLSSSFVTGERIAFDVCEKVSEVDQDFAKSFLDQIKEKCGEDITVAVHCFYTSERGSNAVKKFDGYFEDVRFIDDFDLFTELIKRSRVLNGLDIAKYIISQIKCTQLKLQKLVYLCYADYLCQFNERLFEDTIFAFDLGPVVESINKKYRGKRELDNEIPQDPQIREAIQNRIMFATNGIKKLSSIIETLKKYGSMSAVELVDLTHRPHTPWSVVYEPDVPYLHITDEDIINYHRNE